LEVNKIPGIGEQAGKILIYHKIKFIRDIHSSSPEHLEKLLGKWGYELWNKAQGTHTSTISQYRESKSISKENTFFENVADIEYLMREIVRMTEKICFDLRKEKKVAGCVTIKLRYPDFETTSRQASIPYTSADDQIIPVAKALFHKLYKKGKPVRLLGVRLSNFSDDSVQTNLFQDSERKNALYKS